MRRALSSTQPPAGAIASAAFDEEVDQHLREQQRVDFDGKEIGFLVALDRRRRAVPGRAGPPRCAASSSVSTVVTSTRGASGLREIDQPPDQPLDARDLAIQRLCGIDDFGTPGHDRALAGPAAERRPSSRPAGSIPRAPAWPRARRPPTASRSASGVAGARRAPRRSLRASRPGRRPARPVLRDRRGQARPECAYAPLPTGPVLQARRSAS